MLEKLLILYMLCNTFLAGRFYEDGFHWSGETKRMKFANMVVMIMLICFALVIEVVFRTWEGGKLLLSWLDKTTLIRFYWSKFILGGWRTITQAELKRINDIIEAHKKKSKITLSDRHFFYLMSIINKKRDYKHDTESDQGTESQN